MAAAFRDRMEVDVTSQDSGETLVRDGVLTDAGHREAARSSELSASRSMQGFTSGGALVTGEHWRSQVETQAASNVRAQDRVASAEEPMGTEES